MMKFIKEPWQKVRSAIAHRHEPERLHAIANTYWRILLIVTTLIVVSAVLYGAWQLLLILGSAKGDEETLVGGAGGPSLDSTKLDAVLNDFAERKGRYESLRDNPPELTDPSR